MLMEKHSIMEYKEGLKRVFSLSFVLFRQQALFCFASTPSWLSVSAWAQPAAGAALPRSGGNARRQGPLAVHGLWIGGSLQLSAFYAPKAFQQTTSNDWLLLSPRPHTRGSPLFRPIPTFSSGRPSSRSCSPASHSLLPCRKAFRHVNTGNRFSWKS